MPARSGSGQPQIKNSPTRSKKERAGLLLILAGLVVLALPFYLVYNTLSGREQEAATEIETLAIALNATATPDSQIETLQAQLEVAQANRDALITITNELNAQTDAWPEILNALANYDATQLRLEEISQSESQIVLQGSAVNDQVVMDYTQNLQDSACFERVVIQSIQVVEKAFVQEAASTATPAVVNRSTATSTPVATTTTTATVLPEGDAYEQDDTTPNDIYPDKAQEHTFYPPYDVDLVQFLAKSGRYYRVYTTDLEPGVDTSLTITLGDQIYVNDDRSNGDLSSELVIAVPAGTDVEALVQITNRGQYGTTQSYVIVVEEILASTSTPTPETTATPQATATPASAATARPTYGLEDVYEPDDYDAAELVVGQSQIRTFSPEKDIDQVVFQALPSHRYEIATSWLYPDVDTSLVVYVGEVAYTNDDCSNGEARSCITIDIPAGETTLVTVKVTNNGTFGPGQLYTLGVTDMGIYNTSMNNREARKSDVEQVHFVQTATSASHKLKPASETTTSVQFSILLIIEESE